MKKILLGLILAVLSTAMTSCVEEDDKGRQDNSFAQQYRDINGYYILCEGMMGHNNATLDFFSLKTNTNIQDYFSQANTCGLGETANDMIKIGDELWVLMTGSANLSILDLKTGVKKKDIFLLNSENVNRQARHITEHEGYVYISCFDGYVLKVSTSSKKITDQILTEGRNPEGLAVAGGKLYVANSGGLSYPNYDNKVSVIDLATFKVDTLLQVATNPTIVKAYNNKVYVLSMGNYSGKPILTLCENSCCIDSVQIGMTDFEFLDNEIVFFYQDLMGSNQGDFLMKMPCTDIHAPATSILQTKPNNLRTPYHINTLENTIFITDAKDYSTSGMVFEFNLSGDLLDWFSTSINPSKIIKK